MCKVPFLEKASSHFSLSRKGPAGGLAARRLAVLQVNVIQSHQSMCMGKWVRVCKRERENMTLYMLLYMRQGQGEMYSCQGQIRPVRQHKAVLP